NNEDIFGDKYNRNKTSMVWGGKFEYQTFFSLEPQAIEGIQYLPVTPGSLYLYNKDVIQRDYEYFDQFLSNSSAHLMDYNYMYYAMIKGFGILSKEKIENIKIDTGNSRANL